MSKGESCIKYVIYDENDRKTPTYISRYCGVVKMDSGHRLANSCHRVNNIEVCSCRDSNKCNSASGFSSNVAILAVIVSVFMPLL
jgi:hypothetical protein